MKRIHKPKEKKEHFFDSKSNIIKVGVAAAVVIALVVILMIVESSYGKITIKNNTDLKLEYLNSSYVGTESVIAEGVEVTGIEASGSYQEELEPVNLTFTEANLELVFKFENYEELLADVGYFNDKFDGNLTITFDKTEDPNVLSMKVNAKNGIFQTRNIDCDGEYFVDLKEGGIYQ